MLAQNLTPLHPLPLYLPPATPAYPSSLLINLIPPLLPPLHPILLLTPPPKHPSLSHPLLVPPKHLRISQMYKIPAPQAIATLP
ncbi:histidinol dehydrogenase, partial [Bacillus pumilus]|uniref:histidinol dehydrogenase n=1 Tax=Bacillus pumilus TaxID=1408 RepID=UPI0034D95CA1